MSRVNIRDRRTGAERSVDAPPGAVVDLGPHESVVGVGANLEVDGVDLRPRPGRLGTSLDQEISRALGEPEPAFVGHRATGRVPIERQIGESYADAQHRVLYRRGVVAAERTAAALERSAAVDERRADQIDEANGLHREQLALGRQAAARETRVLDSLEAAKLAESPNAEQDPPEPDLPGAEDHRLIVARRSNGSLRVYLVQQGAGLRVDDDAEVIGPATGRW